jgi:hypothetical protein
MYVVLLCFSLNFLVLHRRYDGDQIVTNISIHHNEKVHPKRKCEIMLSSHCRFGLNVLIMDNDNGYHEVHSRCYRILFL